MVLGAMRGETRLELRPCTGMPDFGNLGYLIKTSPDFLARPVL